MEAAIFGGQEMTTMADDNGGFSLHYLGFSEGPYLTMDQAKAEAPKFARAVLDAMKLKIEDEPIGK